MKTKILMLVVFLLAISTADAQIMFERTYGGISNDWGSCVQQTSDSGFILTGGTYSYGEGSEDVYLIKTNKNGDTLWTKTYGGNGGDFGSRIIQTIDGGYLISGRTSSFGAGLCDIYLIKTNSVGDTIWTKTFGGIDDESAGSVIENSDGSLIVVGSTNSYSTANSAAYILKTDANGLLLWSKTYEKSNISGAGDVHKTNDGNYFVSGYTYENYYNSKLFLLKINENGDTIWTKTISNPDGGLLGAKISPTSDNGIIFTGTMFFINGEAKIYMLKTDTTGNVIWFKKYGGAEYVGGGNSFQTNDGGFILTGVIGNVAKKQNTSSCPNNEFFPDSVNTKMFTNGDLYLLRTNCNGDSLWSRVYGDAGEDVGNSVQQTNDYGYAVCGYTTKGSSLDLFLIKTNNYGYTGIGDNDESMTSFYLYPNPSKGVFQIQVDRYFNEGLNIKVMNISGQNILNKTIDFNKSNQIDLTEYGNGLYLIQFIYKNGFNFSQKVIIQH